ncbi:MAG: hypothetical protein GX607_12740, partial [Myxococcales bacterium]|nr:hypothetical protein [Myxococcales bacterium]
MRWNNLAGLLSLGVCAVLFGGNGCSKRTEDCHYLNTCGGEASGGSGASTGGAGGGALGGGGGACDESCAGGAPVCDAESTECVACTAE